MHSQFQKNFQIMGFISGKNINAINATHILNDTWGAELCFVSKNDLGITFERAQHFLYVCF